MKRVVALQASSSATSFSGTKPARHRLVTAEQVNHAHVSAIGIAADDPGPIGLLRRLVARLPGCAVQVVAGDREIVSQALPVAVHTSRVVFRQLVCP